MTFGPRPPSSSPVAPVVPVAPVAPVVPVAPEVPVAPVESVVPAVAVDDPGVVSATAIEAAKPATSNERTSTLSFMSKDLQGAAAGQLRGSSEPGARPVSEN